jgi:hypothetical protein
VRENEIGQVCELQWVAAVLLEHWIGGGKRQRRLSTVSQGSGGAPARCGAWGREKQWKCKRVMARVSLWGPPGHALGLEEGMGTREQLLASRRHAWRLGRWRRNVEKQGEGQRGVGSGGRGAGAACGAKEGGAGAAGARETVGEGGGVRQRENRERT